MTVQQSHQHTLSSIGGDCGGVGQLKSCLRRGNFSRGRGAVGLDSVTEGARNIATKTTKKTAKAPGGSILHPSSAAIALTREELIQRKQRWQQRQQTKQQQHHKQQNQCRQQQQKQHSQQQRRAEEESSARSAASAPTSQSATPPQSAPLVADSARSATSATSATTTTSRTNTRGGSRSFTTRVVNMTGTTKSGEEDENDERQFMRISKILLAQHTTGRYADAEATQRLLHKHLPRPEQRMRFRRSLQRNVAYLPTFPEPNEHPSLAMTRYAEKVFGPLLTQEMTRKSTPGGERSSSNDNTYEVARHVPPMRDRAQRYPQMFHSQEINATLHPTATNSGHNPLQQLPSLAPLNSPDATSTGPSQPVARYDGPMFPAPPPQRPSSTANTTNTTNIPLQRTSVLLTDQNLPPPVPVRLSPIGSSSANNRTSYADVTSSTGQLGTTSALLPTPIRHPPVYLAPPPIDTSRNINRNSDFNLTPAGQQKTVARLQASTMQSLSIPVQHPQVWMLSPPINNSSSYNKNNHNCPSSTTKQASNTSIHATATTSSPSPLSPPVDPAVAAPQAISSSANSDLSMHHVQSSLFNFTSSTTGTEYEHISHANEHRDQTGTGR